MGRATNWKRYRVERNEVTPNERLRRRAEALLRLAKTGPAVDPASQGNLKATLAALSPTKRKISRSSLLTATCVLGHVWEGSKEMWCRTHKNDGRGGGGLYVRECAACGARYHAKYLKHRLSPGYCSPAV